MRGRGADYQVVGERNTLVDKIRRMSPVDVTGFRGSGRIAAGTKRQILSTSARGRTSPTAGVGWLRTGGQFLPQAARSVIDRDGKLVVVFTG